VPATQSRSEQQDPAVHSPSQQRLPAPHAASLAQGQALALHRCASRSQHWPATQSWSVQQFPGTQLRRAGDWASPGPAPMPPPSSTGPDDDEPPEHPTTRERTPPARMMERRRRAPRATGQPWFARTGHTASPQVRQAPIRPDLLPEPALCPAWEQLVGPRITYAHGIRSGVSYQQHRANLAGPLNTIR
jgi:hypothetical protein